MDHDHRMMLLEQTPLPAPTIEGPYFSHPWIKLQQGDDGRWGYGGMSRGPNSYVPADVLLGETRQLQAYLKQFGYYRGEVSGIWRPLKGEIISSCPPLISSLSGGRILWACHTRCSDEAAAHPGRHSGRRGRLGHKGEGVKGSRKGRREEMRGG